MESLRILLESDSRFQLSEQVQAQAYSYLFQLQATAYNMAIATHPDYPRFYTQQLFEPIYSWLAPNPDFIYSRTIVNPRRSYRISGRTGQLKMIVFQLQSMLFGYGMKRLGDHEITDFMLDSDGRFEIIASAEPQQGNWIKLDPSHEVNVISVRRAMANFGDDIGDIAIAALDNNPEQRYEPSGATLRQRIASAGSMANFTTRELTLKKYHQSLDHGGLNKPWLWGGPEGAAVGGADGATYGFITFELEDHQVMVIETDSPPSLYSGAQLTDVWLQTLDYVYHQSSLGMGQVKLDADGHARYVLGVRDPGVPNWLDTVGNKHGIVLLRWYYAEKKPQVKVKIIPFDEINTYLPLDTIRVSPQQRLETLRARQRAVLKIYGT